LRSHRILQRLEAARDPANDPVAQKVSELFGRPETTRIPLNDELIAKAHRRKLLGNPPTSPDKYTIGDEVIWEALLASVRDDLIVVTRDRTYLSNEQILAREFRDSTQHNLLLVTTKVTEAVKMLGRIPPAKLIEEEDRIDDEEKCPECGGRGEFYGYEGSDGDEAAWFECTKCGYMEFV
jgi:DNA-directed RNA polymerase subunit M/transcription elongation factor TFIIS